MVGTDDADLTGMWKSIRRQAKLYVTTLKNGSLEKNLQKGIEAVKLIADYKRKPTLTNGVQAGLAVVRACMVDQMYNEEFFDCAEWQPAYCKNLWQCIVDNVQQHHTSKHRMASGNTMVYFLERGNVKLAWATSMDSENEVYAFYIGVDNPEESHAYIRQAIWSSVDSSRVLLSAKTTVVSKDKNRGIPRVDDSLKIMTDDVRPTLTSKLAVNYASYLARCQEANVKRTVLFYGPPGVGKTSAVRTICDLMGAKTLRIKVEDIGNMSSDLIMQTMSVFEPDAVIIDDLDRATNQIQLLETFENFHSSVKFVFATVNHLNNMDDALLRPGRFDEIVPVLKMDDEVVRTVLGPANEEAFEMVKTWPVAYIQEYVTRRRFLDADEAMKTVAELQRRVTTAEQRYDMPAPAEDDTDEQPNPPPTAKKTYRVVANNFDFNRIFNGFNRK